MHTHGFAFRIALLTLLAFGSLGSLSAQDSARLQGTLLAPDGTPAVGFRAVLVDIVGGEEQISELSDTLGEYRLSVEAGTRYRILAVLSPEGDRLPVLPHAPMPVRVPGTYRLPDITFMTGMTTPGADSGEIEALPAAENGADNRTPLVPWYRKPGAIVGWVAGGLAVIALAAGGGGSEDPVSPFAAPSAAVDPELPD